jgi:hypothetical protein
MHHDQAWSALALVSNIRTLVVESLRNLVNVTLVITSSSVDDLLNLCLGPQVVDGQRVEGALRPFGVPGLVSLSEERRSTGMANHCLVGELRSQSVAF